MIIQETQTIYNGKFGAFDEYISPEINEVIEFRHIPDKNGDIHVDNIKAEVGGHCEECYYKDRCTGDINESPFVCASEQRHDGQDVYFRHIGSYTIPNQNNKN